MAAGNSTNQEVMFLTGPTTITGVNLTSHITDFIDACLDAGRVPDFRGLTFGTEYLGQVIKVLTSKDTSALFSAVDVSRSSSTSKSVLSTWSACALCALAFGF